ncbi:hypothetical protein A4A49_04339 [Nicotiana attenuata]|uniref:Uncharacterized protein n=1 Tax=Nicotiana attenuata TaxID=49451 RepID=A0A1J6IIU8_NICAT|nr:hypothetical protein A4A49_04339 [Nicotiana attenuata]
MTQKNRIQEKKSLCEKSMEIVVNIITLSSFSLAAINLGGTSNKHHKSSHNSSINVSKVSPFQLQKGNNNNKSQVPTTKSRFYVKEHDQGEKSSRLIHENTEQDQDGNFSDYIKKFHKRNRDDLSAATTNRKASTYIKKFHERKNHESLATAGLPLLVLPPPPNSLVKKPTTAYY